MEELIQTAKSLKKEWEQIYENPASLAVAEAHSDISFEQLNEIVLVVCEWASRQKAPKGFAPAFHLGKALAFTSVHGALSALRSIRAGQPTHYSTLESNLADALSSLHSIAVYSDKSEASNSDVTGQLYQAIQLLQTAQRELHAKLELLKAADQQKTRIDAIANTAAGALSKIEQSATDIAGIEESALETIESIKGTDTEAQKLKNSSADLLKLAQQLISKLQSGEASLEKLRAATDKQSETIAALLPKGASAGLACAFSRRGSELERTKWIWFTAFIASICLLAGLAAFVLNSAPPTAHELWERLLPRIPIAAPLIWLGWFSAVQYGNTIRVQEDYAFKEATSNAFAGYRDHMEHLKDVDAGEGATALELLSLRTIEVLAREPLRIYQRSHRDVSPALEVLELLKKLDLKGLIELRKPKDKEDEQE